MLYVFFDITITITHYRTKLQNSERNPRLRFFEKEFIRFRNKIIKLYINKDE